MSTSSPVADALIVVEAAGTLAFALSGLIEAARKRLDAVGVCLVAGLTAFGGGTLRDVLLDRRPFFWVEHAGWLWALLVVCALIMLFLRARHLPPDRARDAVAGRPRPRPVRRQRHADRARRRRCRRSSRC